MLRYPPLGADARGRVVDELTLNIDLAPTWLELAGVAVPESMQGRSWRPLLTGDRQASPWRTSFLYSYFREGNFAAPTVTAVRTTDAKLIHYPGHPEWTELFDLAADPYETHNLAEEPSRTALRQRLEAELATQIAAVGYHVPEFADERSSDTAGGANGATPPPQPAKAWVLDYDFEQDEGDRVADRSGKGLHGRAQGAKLVAGPDSRKARAFDGESHVNVPRSPLLDPSVGPLRIEATVRATGDGVVIAHGGATLGYSLAIVDGRPALTYRSRSGVRVAEGSEPVVGRWISLAAEVTVDWRLRLEVDGQRVAETAIGEFIHQNPRDGLDIGADKASLVRTPSPMFHGEIDRVRLYSGAP